MENYRVRCYECFRPIGKCFCDAIPTIKNKTEVMILQHTRERFHPFNTARIVNKSLQNCKLFVGHTSALAARTLPIQPTAGLLFPAGDATRLDRLPNDQQLSQLIIVDGTWHHAKMLARDIPALQGLPRFALAPEMPGRYRIRREPNAHSLSTLEATVAALRYLEPDTHGLDELLGSFERMIDDQLAHPAAGKVWRRNRKRLRTGTNIPRMLVGDLDNVVVAYGECLPGERGRKGAPRPPIYWVAERLGSGESYAQTIDPGEELSDELLGHLELTREDFAETATHDQFRRSWANFLRPQETVVVFHQSTASLLTHIQAEISKCLVLKSINFSTERATRTLEDLLSAEGLVIQPARQPGALENDWPKL